MPAFGVIAAVALFWSVISGVLFRVALRVADASCPMTLDTRFGSRRLTLIATNRSVRWEEPRERHQDFKNRQGNQGDLEWMHRVDRLDLQAQTAALTPSTFPC